MVKIEDTNKPQKSKAIEKTITLNKSSHLIHEDASWKSTYSVVLESDTEIQTFIRRPLHRHALLTTGNEFTTLPGALFQVLNCQNLKMHLDIKMGDS